VTGGASVGGQRGDPSTPEPRRDFSVYITKTPFSVGRINIVLRRVVVLLYAFSSSRFAGSVHGIPLYNTRNIIHDT